MSNPSSPLPPSRAGSLPLVGNAAALDFANTASGRGGAQPLEHLREPQDLLRWAAHAGILDRTALRGLAAAMAKSPRIGQRLLAAALGLREAIHAAATRLAAGRQPGKTGLALIAKAHAAALAAGEIRPGKDGCAWHWPPDSPHRLLGPIAASAVALLLGSERARIGACPGVDCGWVFLDRSRAGRRRWCEMSVCGNRAKSRRHALRHRHPSQGIDRTRSSRAAKA